MVSEDLVEVPTMSLQPRTSFFQVVPGEPMALDMTTRNHTDGSILYTKAIYRLKGNVLTYCVGAPSEPRPTEFGTQSGDNRTLVVLTRARARE
jgi:uncharacterized protein (TIGR03067 family)